MKNIYFLVFNLLGSCLAFSRFNENQNEGLKPNKENFLDLTVVLDKDDSMKLMFDSPMMLTENNEDSNGSGETSGTSEIGKL